MVEGNQKCHKCNQEVKIPNYQVSVLDVGNRESKLFCLECWKQEEKNYREMSWKTFKSLSGYEWVRILKQTEQIKGYIEGGIYSPIHWNEEKKKWFEEKEVEKEEDKDINPFIDNDNPEREREREHFSLFQTAQNQIHHFTRW